MKYCYLKANNAVREFSTTGGSLPAGGAEEFLAHFLMLASGNPALILSLHSAPDHDECMHSGNLHIQSMSRQPRAGRFLGLRPPDFSIQFVLGLRIFFQILRFRPHRVLCWARFFPHWFCWLASFMVGAEVVFSRHVRFCAAADPWYRRAIGCIDAFFARRAHAVLVHGPYLKADSLAWDIAVERIVEFDCIYPQGSAWNPGSKEVSGSKAVFLPEHAQAVMFLGRVEACKGVFELYQACLPLMASTKELHLVFAGQGRDMRRLEEAVRHNGLQDRVHFLGRIDHSALPTLIRSAYCLVTPTRSSFPEGRCMAAMEGLIGGKPVIAPNFGPFPYLVQDTINGLLYEPDCVDSLRQTLQRILGDPELYSVLCHGAHAASERLRSNTFGYYHALKTVWP